MKKLILCLLILLAIAFCLRSETQARWNEATKLDEQVLVTAQKGWQVAGVNSTGVAVTALAANERTFKLIQAAVVAGAGNDEDIDFYDVPLWANGARFTAIGITNDGDYVVEILVGSMEVNVSSAISDGTQDSNTAVLGTLAFIIGQQGSATSTYEMAQSVIATKGDVAAVWTTSGMINSDRTCEARIDLQGATFLVISGTTVDADSKLLVKFF